MNDSKREGGLGFTGALTIAFIVLKLCNVITWSWIWVLSPIWISLIIVGILILLYFIVIRKGAKR